MKFKNGIHSAQLSILGYAYDISGDRYNDNWLNICVHYRIDNKEFSIKEPCLLSFELNNFINKIEYAESDTKILFLESHVCFEIIPSQKKLFFMPDFYLRPKNYIPSKFEYNYLSKRDLIAEIFDWKKKYPER